MSSNSSSPYQSNFLNALSRQSRQLTDQCQQALRHARVSAIWSIQLLLFPIYWLFQGARSVGQQLHQAVQERFPPLQSNQAQAEEGALDRALSAEAGAESKPHWPPTADGAIRAVLQTAQTMPLPNRLTQRHLLPALQLKRDEAASVEANAFSLADLRSSPAKVAIAAESPGTLTRPETKLSESELSGLENALPLAEMGGIRAVAMLIANRRLVLVTDRNLILDVLTPGQQWRLHQRIVWETTKYEHYQIAVGLVHRRFSSSLRSPLAKLQQLPLVRQLEQLTAQVTPKLQQAYADAGLPEIAIPPVLKQMAADVVQSARQLIADRSMDSASAKTLANKVGANESASDRAVSLWPGFKVPLPRWLSSVFWKALSPAGALVLRQSSTKKTSQCPQGEGTTAESDRFQLPTATEFVAQFVQRGQSAIQQVQERAIDFQERAIAPFLQNLLFPDTISSTEPSTRPKNSQPGALLKATETQMGQLQNLTQAVLQVFSGKQPWSLPWQNSTPAQIPDLSSEHSASDSMPSIAAWQQMSALLLPKSKATGPSPATASDADPWLTPSDLFGDGFNATAAGTASLNLTVETFNRAGVLEHELRGQRAETARLSLPSGNRLVEWGEWLRSQLQQTLNHLQNRAPLSTNPPNSTQPNAAFTASTVQPNPDFATAQTAGPTADCPTSTQLSAECQATAPEFTPDWIEAPVTPLGYVKHPLERILDWCDRILFWLEQQIAKLWQLLQTWWKNIFKP